MPNNRSPRINDPRSCHRFSNRLPYLSFSNSRRIGAVNDNPVPWRGLAEACTGVSERSTVYCSSRSRRSVKLRTAIWVLSAPVFAARTDFLTHDEQIVVATQFARRCYRRMWYLSTFMNANGLQEIKRELEYPGSDALQRGRPLDPITIRLLSFISRESMSFLS